MSQVGPNLQSKLLLLSSIIKQRLHSEQGGVLWAPQVLQPVLVHLPQPGVVCPGRPPAYDVCFLSCTVQPQLSTTTPSESSVAFHGANQLTALII